MARGQKNLHGEAFLEAICAAPDDATLRLVYADYLEEQGRPQGACLRRPGHWVLWTEGPCDGHGATVYLCWEDLIPPFTVGLKLSAPVIVGWLKRPVACSMSLTTGFAGWPARTTGAGACIGNGLASVHYGGRWLCWACAAELSRQRLRLLDRRPAAEPFREHPATLVREAEV